MQHPKALAVALFGARLAIAQSNPAIDAYERGVQLGNQQTAVAVDCLSHPSCIAALQAAQARKDAAKAEKAQLRVETQSRKDAAKAEKERQRTEVKLARLRLQT